MVDALSRKAEIASMTSQPQGDIMDLLRNGLRHDLVDKSLIVLAHEEKTKRFWVEDDLLYTKERRLYMPKWENIRKFWTNLFKLIGSNFHFSISFRPQTDGQTKKVNALLELYLRHFVSANQKDWANLLDVAQFSYKLQRSEATNKSPFELAIGQ
ncbi:hypothetical protein CK203_030501 [Vitis vinifera]|uniref:Integrase catalytic domain-containing protein n=1 Tax=Vitis vinifera TaxID=29760 RepID=A0A438JDP3_VITVI|nr:hypothetical protein CK203_030501 [Vitis vinifera]